jgi:hypothetical protein
MNDLEWLAFSYSLPAKSGSSTRVTLWRQLRRLGAVSPAGSVYVLPVSDETVEALQWMTEEVRQSGGDALTMRVGRFHGLSDGQVVDLFNTARAAEYAEIDEQAAALEMAASGASAPQEQEKLGESLARLRRRHAEIARTDYFGSPAGLALAARLARVGARLSPREPAPQAVPTAQRELYLGRSWVTRARPFVDRLACAWLIRRFIDSAAEIRFGAPPAAGDVTFDMEGAEFGHHSNLCTFETLLLAFGLDDAGLRGLAEIVHEIDLHDGRYLRAETAGVEAVLRGWHEAGLADAELQERGRGLFEGLYAALQADRRALAAVVQR